jgi:hypothetical protein
MVAMERRAVPRLIRQSTITPELLSTPQTYVVSALAGHAPGGWSVAGDLAAVDVQDLAGNERR